MGISTRHFIYDKDSSRLIKITNSKFDKLFNIDSSFSLKEYSNQTIKYITVIIENVNRKPVQIIDIKYGILKIDNNGRVDKNFRDELDRDAMSMMSSVIPSLNIPENVIDSSSDFAKEKYKNKYTWNPSPELEEKIENMIFTKLYH